MPELPEVEIVKKSLFKMINKATINKIKTSSKKLRFNKPSLLSENLVGEKGKLFTENLEVSVNFYNDLPISVDLPKQVTCKIQTTDAALKGQTVSSSYKPAVLDNGLNIQVPPFIEAGDNVIIDTRNLEYIKKI